MFEKCLLGEAACSLTIGNQEEAFHDALEGAEAHLMCGGKLGELSQEPLHLQRGRDDQPQCLTELPRPELASSPNSLPLWAQLGSGKALLSGLRTAVKRRTWNVSKMLRVKVR